MKVTWSELPVKYAHYFPVLAVQYEFAASQGFSENDGFCYVDEVLRNGSSNKLDGFPSRMRHEAVNTQSRIPFYEQMAKGERHV